MIRFCDRDVGIVEYDSLNRKELLEYFSSGHEEGVLCVYDDFATMRYIGKITSYSLQHSININSAIQEEYVILDKDMWYKAREYFVYRNGTSQNNFLLPIFNKEGQLICFAYEDEDANREIRMLRELSEHPEALQFKDVYSDYLCVKIYEFNELAYFFAKYLEDQNVPVQVYGAMWSNFFVGDASEVPDYACLTIYSEGVAEKKRNLLENILRSVSVEFECIDQIYETNIKKGVFQNAEGSWEELANRLRSEKEIVILGTDIEAQRAWGFLTKNGIDICCFMGGQHHRMFGKEILNRFQIQRLYKSPVFIDCKSIGSAWGVGDVDYYDYVGYERNRKFILLRDYIEVPDGSVIEAVRKRKIVLIGDLYLCRRLFDHLERSGIMVAGYFGMLPQDTAFCKSLKLQIDYTDKDVTWLIVTPTLRHIVFYGDETWQKERELAENFCREKGIVDYTDCFSYVEGYVGVESIRFSIRKSLMPKRIVIGSIDDHSGNIFLKGVLDDHPSIMVICEYESLNFNMFWICASLAVADAQDILPLFWNLYGAIASKTIYNKEKFDEKMSQLLKEAKEEKFTSQELFVMFHIAYMYMGGRNITESDISNMVIYWEPHDMYRKNGGEWIKWLSGEKEDISCSIIKVVRNICMQTGSRIKDVLLDNRVVPISKALHFHSIEDEKSDNRLVVRFEDLKCKPRELLLNICEQWDIPWSESLMVTTSHGERLNYYNGERLVSDFDLGPVYDTYEKYISAFDRLRFMIFNAPWQRKYGYPYVEVTQFSRRELQEMFLKKFRFEDLTEFQEDEKMKIMMQKRIRAWLQEVRMRQ